MITSERLSCPSASSSGISKRLPSVENIPIRYASDLESGISCASNNSSAHRFARRNDTLINSEGICASERKLIR